MNNSSNNNRPISELMGITMEKIKEMVDINSIIGDPITLDDGTTIIPISKVSYGFASGGISEKHLAKICKGFSFQQAVYKFQNL